MFGLQTRCVTGLYTRLFPRFKTENCWKVMFECVQVVTQPHYRNLSGVYALEIKADVDSFFALTDDQRKKEWTAACLEDGLNRLLLQTGWIPESFQKTLTKARELGLTNRWTWSKPVLSPSRRLRAEVLVDHDVQSCKISIVVQDRNHHQIATRQVVSDLPDEWAYARHLGSLVWESETRVTLRNKSKDTTWHLDI